MTTRPHLLTEGAPHAAEHVDELAEIRAELEGVESRIDALEESYGKDREQLARLLAGIKALFGGSTDAAASVPPSGTSPRWEALKKAFPGRPAELVDVLIAHGPLNTTQIAAIMRADPRTVAQLIYKLNKAGGIEKNGGKFSLK